MRKKCNSYRCLFLLMLMYSSSYSHAEPIGELQNKKISPYGVSPVIENTHNYIPVYTAQNNEIEFVENKGQVIDNNNNLRPDVLYASEKSGEKVYLRKNGITHLICKSEEEEKNKIQSTEAELSHSKLYALRLDIDFIGTNTNKTIKEEEPSSGFYNYYLSHCTNGITHLKAFKKITYENLYHNINISFYGNKESGLEYDFIVKPGGNVKDIKLSYAGMNNLELENGKLRIKTSLGEVIECIPKVYQKKGNAEKLLNGTYQLNGTEITFNILDDYDKTIPLIIDPWVTYYGGNNDDTGNSIDTDQNGNAFITGYTRSPNLPVSSGVTQTAYYGGGAYNTYVAKFDLNGAHQWTTYYGGTGGNEVGMGIAADKFDNSIVFGGYTNSVDFPVSGGAFQTNNAGGISAFIVKLSNNTGSRVWGTFYGGSGWDFAHALAVDGSDNILLTGKCASHDLPYTAGHAQSNHAAIGYYDAFVAKFNSAGNCVWATYYGGTGDDERGLGIAADQSDNVFFTGWTNSINFPVTPNAFQTVNKGGMYDAFVVKLDNSGNLKWSTYLGGADEDDGLGVALDGFNNIIVSGRTTSPNFPITAGAFQTSYGGNYDAFLIKLNNSGNPLWSSYYGIFSSYETASGVDVDDKNNVYICGEGDAIVTSCAYQTVFGGGNGDVYIAKFDSAGILLCSTFLGGPKEELGGKISVYNGYMYITGTVTGAGLPVTPGAFQTAFGGPGGFPFDAFVAKMCTNSCGANNPAISFSANQTTVCPGGSINFTSTGNPCDLSGTTWLWSFPGGNPVSSTSQNPDSIIYNVLGTYDVSLTVQACGTASVTYSGYIVVANSVPTLIVSSNVSVCLGIVSTFTISGATTYIWSPSTGLSSITGSTINASPPAGINTYTVTGLNGDGCGNYTGVVIKVYALPTLIVTPQNSAMCNGAPPLVIVTAGSADYTWSPSTGLSSTTGSTINANPPLGINTYTVTTGVDGNGCSNHAGVVITVNGLPTLLVTPNSIMCIGDPPLVIGVAGAVNYTWNPSAGLSSTTGSLITVIAPLGINTYTVTGIDNNGCINYTGLVITVNSLPTIYASSDITVCIGSSTVLTASGANTYTWLPDVFLSTTLGLSTVVTPTIAVTIPYTVTGVSIFGCYGNSATINVTACGAVPSPPYLVLNPDICIGDTVTLSAPILVPGPCWGYSEFWIPSVNLVAVTAFDYILDPSPTVTTVYTITETDNYCPAISQSLTYTITVNDLPDLTVMQNSTICAGEFVVLVASGANSYAWNPNNSLNPNTGPNVSASPGSTITYTVTGSNGNCTSDTIITVKVNPLPTIDVGINVTINLGQSVHINATGNGISYHWLPPSGLNCDTCQSTIASPLITTTYYVTVTNDAGCQSTDSVIVTVKLNCADDIYVPDAFSPNGDGQNDVLYIKIQSGCINSMTFRIYDRWGTKVFESYDPTSGWDGKRASSLVTGQVGPLITGFGKEFDPAVFVYQLQAELIDGTPVNKKGNISLVR